MHKFCQECGTQAVENDQVCRNCGVSLGKEVRVSRVVKKAPITRKQKSMRIVIGVFAALVIGFCVWANTYHSAKSVEQRFSKAIDSKDAAAMSKLAVHEDGTTITQGEAKAVLALVKVTSKGKVSGLSTTVPSGRFLGVFNDHKIEFIDQFVYFEEADEALTFRFNGKKMKEFKRNKDNVVFGPISPGIYDVEALFEGKYGSTSSKETLQFASQGREEQLIEINLQIAKVRFDIVDYDPTIMEDAVILFNEEKISVDEYGETEPIGPFLIDGSQQVKVSATMPWGEGVSVEVPIDSKYVTIPAGIISDAAYDELLTVLKTYGEENQKVYAERNPDLFTVLTKAYKSSEGNVVVQSLRENYYTGSFDLLEVDRNSIVYVENDGRAGIEISTRYHNKESVHEVINKPALEELVVDTTIELIYNKAVNAWEIDRVYESESSDFKATDEVEGSGVVYKPSKELEKAAKEKDVKAKKEEKEKVEKVNVESVKAEMADFMYEFHGMGVDAINERDYSYVENYHTSSGKSGKESRDYIDYLESKGITEDHLGTEVEKIVAVNDNTWKVTSVEKFRIIRPDSSDVKNYRSVTIVKRVDGRLQMDELVSTDEI